MHELNSFPQRRLEAPPFVQTPARPASNHFPNWQFTYEISSLASRFDQQVVPETEAISTPRPWAASEDGSHSAKSHSADRKKHHGRSRIRHHGSTVVDDSLKAWPFGWRRLPASKHRRKSSLRQYPCDFRSLIPLNFNPPFLHSSTNAARLLHFLCEFLLLWQTNAHEVLYHRHRLAAPSGFHAKDVHPTSGFARGILRTSRWKTCAFQIGKWIVEVAHARSLSTRYSMSMPSRSCPFHDSESLLSNSPYDECTAEDTESQSAPGGELNCPIEPLTIRWLLGLNASQKEDCGCDYQKTAGDEFHNVCLFVESN